MPTDMKLPELGENIEGGDVLRVMVKEGDAIKKDQAVLELETDKATIEVPSSAAGVVKAIKVKAGEKVKVGQTIFQIEEGADGGQAPEGEKKAEAKTKAAPKTEPQKAEAAKAEAPEEAPEDEPKAEAPKRKAEVVEMKPSKPAAAPASPKPVEAQKAG
jgi:pyruvate dehydrogenase E2 component (dihydrolipoamide acetyltransferase)